MVIRVWEVAVPAGGDNDGNKGWMLLEELERVGDAQVV